MKKHGNRIDFTDERNVALVSLFRRKIREASLIDLDAIFLEISRSPAPRFFISEERALYLIKEFRRTGQMKVRIPLRCRLMEDLLRAVDSLLRRSPELTLAEAVFRAVNSPAPSYYLTPGSCRTIIYTNLKKGSGRSPVNQK